MKLNLGGRSTRIPGFLTVDLYEGEGVDVHADIASLKDIDPLSVDEIYASHCLEHFPHTKTIEVLTNWHRVLKPKAKAFVSVPDFDAIVWLYQQAGLNDFIRNILYGDQGYDKAYHYTVFNFSSLASSLVQAGFSDVKRIKLMPYGIQDCSLLADTVFHKPLSVNVEATA